MKTYRIALCSALFLAVTTSSAVAEIAVEGVQDKQVVSDRIALRIVPVDGFTDNAQLNGKTIAVDSWIEVAQPDFYELRIDRTSATGAPAESRLVRFIIRASERGDTEWGLPPWTPFPAVASAAAEFAGAELHLVLPTPLPADLEMPVIAQVDRVDGRPVRVNGTVSVDSFPAFELRRGVGSVVLPAMAGATNRSLTAQVGPLTVQRTLTIEPNPTWTVVSGSITGPERWPENSRIQIDSNLVLTAEADLRIGPGTVVKLAPGVEIRLSGKVVVEGNSERPVLFTAPSRSQPWGGFVLRTNSAQLQMTGAILTGAGADPDWFGSNPGSGESHRHEQPLLYLANSAQAALTNCYLIHNQGQAAHGENGLLTMTGCLVQRCITTGQFNGGTVRFERSAFIEFPVDDDLFADADNDAMYFTEGTHVISDCLIGWAKDDAIDAGSGGPGNVTVTGCWIESCYHEGLAWSGTGRIARSRDTVILNCGQAIEAGWNSPDVFAENCLCLNNLVGTRFGDNYNWTYDGFLRVTHSFLLFNYRNIWGRNWNDWTERLDHMDVQSNFVSVLDPNHPKNGVWSVEDGPGLIPFLSTPPSSDVGVAFATRAGKLSIAALSNSIPVGLSCFSSRPVTVQYVAETAGGISTTGSVHFAPGETVKALSLSLASLSGREPVQVRLHDPANAAVTGPPLLFLPDSGTNPKLVPAGSEWNYWDTGVEPPPDWRALSFNDTSWQSGRAELGYGDNDEVTVINGGPSTNRYSAAYFRHTFVVAEPKAHPQVILGLRRDDGAIVYLNEYEVFRSNMPTGLVDYATLALSNASSETEFYLQNIERARLVAGTNIVAVEVHQASKTSSDLSFDLELTGTPEPKLKFQSMPAGTLWLYWDDPDWRLEEASTVTGPWRKHPATSTAVPVTPPSVQFYRLARKP